MSDYLTMAELENKTLKEVYSYAKEFKIPYNVVSITFIRKATSH